MLSIRPNVVQHWTEQSEWMSVVVLAVLGVFRTPSVNRTGDSCIRRTEYVQSELCDEAATMELMYCESIP